MDDETFEELKERFDRIVEEGDRTGPPVSEDELEEARGEISKAFDEAREDLDEEP